MMLRVLLVLALASVPMVDPTQGALPDYKAWRAACAKLPTNRELKGKMPDPKALPLPTFADFEPALDGFLKLEREGPLADAKKWVGKQPDPKPFFDATRGWFSDPERVPFVPFAGKLVLPNDAVTIIMGDLHGDIRSLMSTLDDLNERGMLDGFRFKEAKYYLLFLGDFTDRGAYGVEVLYTLFRLKMANPEQVYFTRGNHEDFILAARYGFLDELRLKYGQQANLMKVFRTYDLLPVVWYVGNGSDFLQMNHGGMEPGYDPRELLASTGSLRYQQLGDLRQKTYHKARPGWLGDDVDSLAVADKFLRDFTPEAPTTPAAIGFMWNDFTVFGDEPSLSFDRSLIFGPKPTRRVLADASTDRVKVRAVVRAHQHSGQLNPLMSRLVASDGAFTHWHTKETKADAEKSVKEIRLLLKPEQDRPIPDGSVWTFNVTPDSVYGVGCGYDFATIGMLRMATAFADWRLKVLRINVF